MKTQRFVAVTMGIMVLSAGLLFTAGCGSDDQSAVPQQGVSTPIGVLAVSAGLDHSLAVKKSDGTVWAWGGNGSGKLGNLAAQIKQPTPMEVGESPPGVTSFLGMVAVSAGGDHSLALKGDGTVWAWGGDFFGQLGDDVAAANKNTPVQVVAGASGSGFLTDVGAVSAGGSHSLALKKSDGTVWAWGNNVAGQLGDFNLPDPQNCNLKVPTDPNSGNINCPKPVQVGKRPGAPGTSLNGVVAVSAGNFHSLALKGDGTVWAWGTDAAGQLGNDALLVNQPTPVQVKGAGGSGFLTDVVAVSAGHTHSLALKGDGTVWAWGSDAAGQLGNDVPLANQPTPVQVAGLTDVRALSAGNSFSLALKNDGTVWAWGGGGSGQLGNDVPLVNQPMPVQVKGAGGSGFLTDVSTVSAGGSHSLALKGDGTVWAWGSDFAGQVGNDNAVGGTEPTPVPVDRTNLGP